MSEIPISGTGPSSIPSEISTTFAGARYKTMSPARLPITRSPCLTIPSGFSPGALLESPVLLTNLKAEPSPTTGTFAMPLIVNNGGLTALDSPKDSSKGCVHEDGSSPYFEFRPHIRLSSRPGLSSLAPSVSLGSNPKLEEFTRKNQSVCETNGPSSSQVVKTENLAQSSAESTWSVTASGSPVEVFAVKSNGFTEDASNELQQTNDPDCMIQASQSDHNGSTPLNAVEKSAEDGYNWRKYGQKHVKGSEFPRSYYKCTHPNCQMKKQLERSHDGQITEIMYKGQHDHPKPQASRRFAVGVCNGQEEEKDVFSSLANAEEKFSNAHGHTSQVHPNCNSELSPVSISDDEVEVEGGQSGFAGFGGDEVAADDDPESKRRKMEFATIDANSIAKNNREPRVVVQTVSEVDILDDGYRWRKYGQKVVKGNPNPRSYYKCTNPGCSVRKHVERASHDPKAVITTYEGKHNHDVPAAKTSSNREASPPLIPDGNIPRTYLPHQYSQPAENNTISLHLGVGVGSNHTSLLNEKQHLSDLARIPSHHHHHHQHNHLQYASSDCSNVMIQVNPVSKLYGSSNNAVFGSREDEGEGFSFSTQINNSSSHYYPRVDNLVMGP